jgi:hypothetical protein
MAGMLQSSSSVQHPQLPSASHRMHTLFPPQQPCLRLRCSSSRSALPPQTLTHSPGQLAGAQQIPSRCGRQKLPPGCPLAPSSNRSALTPSLSFPPHTLTHSPGQLACAQARLQQVWGAQSAGVLPGAGCSRGGRQVGVQQAVRPEAGVAGVVVVAAGPVGVGQAGVWGVVAGAALERGPVGVLTRGRAHGAKQQDKKQ